MKSTKPTINQYADLTGSFAAIVVIAHEDI